MLKTLSLKNFQSHKHTELNFTEGVNIIVGSSDSGKTALIRAIKKLVTNRPNGESFRSNWGGDTEIKLELSDGSYVLRGFSKKEGNFYESSNFEKLFKAFGQDVPEEIKTHLNFLDVNLQEQMDSPFLLSETPGKVSQVLNELAGLDKIHSSFSFINSSIRKLNNTITHTKQTVKEKETELSKYDNLESFEKKLEEINQLYLKYSKLEKSYDSLTLIGNKLIGINNRKLKYKNQIKYEQIINLILEKIELKKSLKQKHAKLKKLALDYYYLKEDIVKQEKTIKLEIHVNKLLDLFKIRRGNKVILKKLIRIESNITRNIKMQENIRKELKEKEQYFHNNYPSVCPFCNSTLKSE